MHTHTHTREKQQQQQQQPLVFQSTPEIMHIVCQTRSKMNKHIFIVETKSHTFEIWIVTRQARQMTETETDTDRK